MTRFVESSGAEVYLETDVPCCLLNPDSCEPVGGSTTHHMRIRAKRKKPGSEENFRD